MEYKKITGSQSTTSADRLPLKRTLIEPKFQATALKPGDHIAWQRAYVICHHAIVVETDTKRNTMTVIHFTKSKKKLKIIQEKMKIKRGLYKSVYRIDYDQETAEKNPPDQVLKRARDKLSEAGYKLFSNNCETFATFCKTGYEGICIQAEWANAKCKTFIQDSVCTSAKVPVQMNTILMFSEPIVIKVMKYANIIVGTVITVASEAALVMRDIKKFYQRREQGDMTYSDFIQKVVERIVEGILPVLGSNFFALIGNLIGWAFGPVGAMLGVILGGFVGKCVGNVTGNMAGTLVGNAVRRSIKTKDKPVKDIEELKPGDHIVLYMWALHPRCHAIVVGHDGKKTINVIQNTYKKGVVEKSIENGGRQIYKVVYDVEISYPDEVLERARKKIGEKKYSLAKYNCKTFARYCKTGRLKHRSKSD